MMYILNFNGVFMKIKIYWTKLNSPCISAPEQVSAYRAARLGKGRRMQGLAAEALLYRALSEYDNCIKLPPDISVNEWGKPYIENCALHFSISHSGDIAACAVSECELGLDIQQSISPSDKLLKRYFTEAERQEINTAADFARLWSAKESYVKATGRGIARGFADAGLSFAAGKEISCGGFRVYSFAICGMAASCCPLTGEKCEFYIEECFSL